MNMDIIIIIIIIIIKFTINLLTHFFFPLFSFQKFANLTILNLDKCNFLTKICDAYVFLNNLDKVSHIAYIFHDFFHEI